MRCDRCRDREAVVHLETINGPVVTSTYLCEVCARQGAGAAAGAASAPSLAAAARSQIPPDVLVAIVADVEARSNPVEIAHLLARIDRYRREQPAADVPPEVIAFQARHRPGDPPTA